MWAPPSQAYVVLRSDPWPLLIPGKCSTYCATFPASLPFVVVLRSPPLWAWSLTFPSTTVLEFVFVYFYYLEVSGGFAQEPCHWGATLCFLILFCTDVFKRDLLSIMLALSCSDFSRWISLLFSLYIFRGANHFSLANLTCHFYHGLWTHTPAWIGFWAIMPRPRCLCGTRLTLRSSL